MGEAPCGLLPPASCSTPVEPLPKEILNEMMANLEVPAPQVSSQKLTSLAEMLNNVFRDNQGALPGGLQSSLRVPAAGLWCGSEGGGSHRAHLCLGPTLGLTCDEMLSDGQGLPKATASWCWSQRDHV